MESTCETKVEFQEKLIKILKPIPETLKNGEPGLLKIGSSGTTYNEKIRQAEGFLRLLWGYSGYYHGKEIDDNFTILAQGIASGVNPDSESYWGDLSDVNQLMVEMAPLAVFVLLNEEKVKKIWSLKDQENLVNWLKQINDYRPAQNNWLFFRILTDTCLKKVFGVSFEAQVAEDFTKIDSFYLDHGWYFDGVTNQLDYYISFAIHYYSLLYVYFCEKEDPKRCQTFRKRAVAFYEGFRYWFDRNGRGIPFGRSLTYRFAQSSFFAACLLVNLDVPQEEAKYFLEKNIENWLQQDIFSPEGFLKIGYYYENLVMAEEYNSPGSPYWSLKPFILLALDQENPVWQLKSEQHPKKNKVLLPEPHMLVTTSSDKQEVKVYVTGQFCEQHVHGEAKYSKFVYSTNFGFSVSKGLTGWDRGGFDNVLAVSEDGQHFQVRTKSEKFEVTENYTHTLWHPFKDTTFESFIIPFGEGHFRLHYYDTKRPLVITDGGFSIAYDGEKSVIEKLATFEGSLQGKNGFSQVVSLDKYMTAHTSLRLPNQNLLYNCVEFPYLKGNIAPQSQGVIVNYFLGETQETKAISSSPTVELNETQLIVTTPDEKVSFTLQRF